MTTNGATAPCEGSGGRSPRYLRKPTGLGAGFIFIVGVVLLFFLGAGAVLLRGLFRT